MTKPAPAPNAEQFQAFAETLRRATASAVRRMADDARALRTVTPSEADEYERDRAPSAERHPGPGSCHCPCGAHPEFPGTCTGHAEPGLTGVLDSPAGGPRQVPLCRNCHDIRMGLAPQRGSALEAVTDTCTCHCQANHPGRPGICEAGSDDGVLIDGSPACAACEEALLGDTSSSAGPEHPTPSGSGGEARLLPSQGPASLRPPSAE